MPGSGPRPALQKSPTTALLFGLVITLGAVLAFAAYMTVQLSGLRRLQSDLVERNRRDSLQLLRIQNDLNSLSLAMRDMLDAQEPYPLTAWTAQFDRIREDLDAASGWKSSWRRAAARKNSGGFSRSRSRNSGMPWTGCSHTPEADARPRRGTRFASPCSRARKRSARRYRGCSLKTTKANSKPRQKSRRSTTACSTNYTSF